MPGDTNVYTDGNRHFVIFPELGLSVIFDDDLEFNSVKWRGIGSVAIEGELELSPHHQLYGVAIGQLEELRMLLASM